MKPSRIAEELKVCIAADVPVFLSGPPGVGKSEVVRLVADQIFGAKYGMVREGTRLIDKKTGKEIDGERPYYRDIRALLLDPVDVRGLPYIEEKVAHWSRPAFLPTKGSGILFLDELPNAPTLTQNSFYQLIQDRMVGEHRLPKGWLPIAAGNRESDRSGVIRTSAALNNRFVHLEFDVDLDDWIAWALDAEISTETMAFIRFRPELLHKFDPAKKANPTPRTWEFVDRLYKASKGNLNHELAVGTVGEGAASEYVAFLKVYHNLPDPDFVLMSPEKAQVPTDPATLYAICGALANKATDQTFERIVKYGNRLPPEFSVLLIRDSLQRNAKLVQTRAYIEWASKHKDVLL